MKKVLAIKQRRLGDTALWTAALEALRESLGCSFDIAYPAPYAALFDLDPRFEKHYPLSSNFTSQWDTLKEIRKTHYDAVLNFHANNQTAFLTRFSKSRTKLIHHHNRSPRHTKFSKTIPNVGTPMSALERDLNVVRGLGWSGKSPQSKIFVSSSHKRRGEELLNSHFKSSPKKKIALSVTASRPSKQWPLENFLALARALSNEAQVFVFYDSPPSSSLWAQLKIETTAIHTADLSSLIGCLSFMDGFMGADSGVKHVAAALKIPTVTVFGPESIGEWHGYPIDRHKALQFPVSCRDHNIDNPLYAWCGHEVCPLASHACLSQISPEKVYTEIKTLMNL